MTGEGFFLDISKIAVTFLGFASAIAAFRYPRDVPWVAREVAGLKFINEHATAAMLLARIIHEEVN